MPATSNSSKATRGARKFIPMIDAVSTNKTDFFREAHHYEVLVSKCLPYLHQQHESRDRCTPNIWSAACSTGEEPYTLAIVLAEASLERSIDFSILASDISTHALAKAVAAVYSKERMPVYLRYWSQSALIAQSKLP